MNEKKEYNTGFFYTIGNWQQKDVSTIFAKLERPNWAPWLEAMPKSLAGRAATFPDGQLIIKSICGEPLASLSMNKINWNGDVKTLPSWDAVAGEPTTYENTYMPFGNTLAMMSMNVNPDNIGEGYARTLIDKSKELAIKLNIDYLIGSFRPNEFGKYKLEHKEENIDFITYCALTRSDGLPIDGWLRNLTRNGMQPLVVDTNAMVIPILIEVFEEYKQTYKPNKWHEITQNIWECGEVGAWKVDNSSGIATYRESNLWGLIWKNPGLL